MIAVAYDNGRERYRSVMHGSPPHTPSSDLAAFAKAIKRLRQRADITQAEAALRIGQTKQSWQAYEDGKRQVILRIDVQERVARALGVTRDELVEERERLGAANEDRFEPPPPRRSLATVVIPVWGRARAGLRGAHVYDINEPERYLDVSSIYTQSTRAMQLIGDSVYPWAASGTTIVYDTDRWPRRGQGCVIHTIEDGYYIKLFEKADDEYVYVTELQPEPRELKFKREDLVGVFAVIDRIDH